MGAKTSAGKSCMAFSLLSKPEVRSRERAVARSLSAFSIRWFVRIVLRIGVWMTGDGTDRISTLGASARPARRQSMGTPMKKYPEGFAGLYERMDIMVMILPQVHLRKPCYDFTFL